MNFKPRTYHSAGCSCGCSEEDLPVVYFTKDISSEGVIAAYKALGWTPTGKLAVKMHSGESEKSNYLRP